MRPIEHLRLSGFLPLFLVAGIAWGSPPERVRITYDTSYNGLVVAEIVEVLDHDDRTYSIVSVVKGRGILALAPVLKRSSRGRITPQGLRPDEYRDQRGDRWAVTAKFDWNSRSITQDKNGKAETLDMPVTAQDPLSLAYSFAFFPPTGKEFEVTRADGRGLSPFRFLVVGPEKLSTPAGELQTLRISKVRDGPEDKATDIWFATERDYLPVRILIVDKDGTRADQVATRIGN
jgi:hypothetical protein